MGPALGRGAHPSGPARVGRGARCPAQPARCRRWRLGLRRRWFARERRRWRPRTRGGPPGLVRTAGALRCRRRAAELRSAGGRVLAVSGSVSTVRPLGNDRPFSPTLCVADSATPLTPPARRRRPRSRRARAIRERWGLMKARRGIREAGGLLTRSRSCGHQNLWQAVELLRIGHTVPLSPGRGQCSQHPRAGSRSSMTARTAMSGTRAGCGSSASHAGGGSRRKGSAVPLRRRFGALRIPRYVRASLARDGGPRTRFPRPLVSGSSRLERASDVHDGAP